MKMNGRWMKMRGQKGSPLNNWYMKIKDLLSFFSLWLGAKTFCPISVMILFSSNWISVVLRRLKNSISLFLQQQLPFAFFSMGQSLNRQFLKKKHLKWKFDRRSPLQSYFTLTWKLTLFIYKFDRYCSALSSIVLLPFRPRTLVTRLSTSLV